MLPHQSYSNSQHYYPIIPSCLRDGGRGGSCLSFRYIYVLADSPLRQRYHAYSSRCSDILLALFKRIHGLFPRAVVRLAVRKR